MISASSCDLLLKVAWFDPAVMRDVPSYGTDRREPAL